MFSTTLKVFFLNSETDKEILRLENLFLINILNIVRARLMLCFESKTHHIHYLSGFHVNDTTKRKFKSNEKGFQWKKRKK